MSEILPIKSYENPRHKGKHVSCRRCTITAEGTIMVGSWYCTRCDYFVNFSADGKNIICDYNSESNETK